MSVPTINTNLGEHADSDELQIVLNASHKIPKASSLIHSSAFLTGAGAVIFHRKSKRVVLVIDEREEARSLGWFLPKGRKDVGESLEHAACREGEEESGYPNHLLPVPVATRAPKKALDRNFLSTEPIYMHNWAISPRKGFPSGGLYTVFWYVCEVTDEDLDIVEATKKLKDTGLDSEIQSAESKGKVFMDYHELQYRAELFEYDEAIKLINHSADAMVFGTVLATAVELVRALDVWEGKSNQAS